MDTQVNQSLKAAGGRSGGRSAWPNTVPAQPCDDAASRYAPEILFTKLTLFVSSLTCCIALTVLVTVAGCGNDNPGEAEARSVAADFLRAVAQNSPTSCGYMSESELERVSELVNAGDAPSKNVEAACKDYVSSQQEENIVPFDSGVLREAATEALEGEIVMDEDELVISLSPDGGAAMPSSISLIVEDGVWKVNGSL